jgi:hypothetical protein
MEPVIGPDHGNGDLDVYHEPGETTSRTTERRKDQSELPEDSGGIGMPSRRPVSRWSSCGSSAK